jgi:hypothetical protein
MPRTTLPAPRPHADRAFFSKDDETMGYPDAKTVEMPQAQLPRTATLRMETAVDSEKTIVSAPRWRQGNELRTPIPPSVIVAASIDTSAVSARIAAEVLGEEDIIAVEQPREPIVEPTTIVEPVTTVSAPKRAVPRASTAARIGMVSAIVISVLMIAGFTFAIVMRPSRASAVPASASAPVAMISMTPIASAPQAIARATNVATPMAAPAMVAPAMVAAAVVAPAMAMPKASAVTAQARPEVKSATRVMVASKARTSSAPARPQARAQAHAQVAASDNAGDIMARAL